MAFARVNGVVLHYEDRGEAGRPVLVFANSLGTDFRIWDALVALLGDRFRFVRYDKATASRRRRRLPMLWTTTSATLNRFSTISA